MNFFPEDPLIPDEHGFFGDFGGVFVPEILRPNLDVLAKAFKDLTTDREFWDEFVDELRDFSGRPTPITHLKNLSGYLGGAQILLKREDLSQTGAHKVNNVVGQGLLTKKLGKKRIIAETGAGQHGVATATMAARFGFEAIVYMGAEDVHRQRPNVFWMEQMGAKVVAVEDGTATLKDAINEAMRDWSTHPESTHYVLGTACGPHPFPAMVAFFQSIIGNEAFFQCRQNGTMPSRVYGCVGGGSNALGIWQGFLDPKLGIELVGGEAGGRGKSEHAARFHTQEANLGIAQGYKTIFLQSNEGQMKDTYSVAAGLDYVGVSPIIAYLESQGRVRMEQASDDEVLDAVRILMQKEGIISSLESAHGLACAIRESKAMKKDEYVLVNLSGRGDKDIFTIAEALGDPKWNDYLKRRAQAIESKES